MREFIQHGDVTTYQHCKNVVLVSFWLNRRFHLGADETSLAVGAFLHDFYLYDWHKRSSCRGLRRLFEMRGFAHPGSACVECRALLRHHQKEQNVVSSRVWPPDLPPCAPPAGRRSSSAWPTSCTAPYWKVWCSSAPGLFNTDVADNNEW